MKIELRPNFKDWRIPTRANFIRNKKLKALYQLEDAVVDNLIKCNVVIVSCCCACM